MSSRLGTALGTLLVIAAWFGILAGLIEGADLLAFQKINWRAWGILFHVSPPILWIAPLVNLVLFLSIALLLVLTAWFWPKLPAFRVAVFAFAALTLYDWLLISRRLDHLACFLLAAGLGVVFSRWTASRQFSVLRFWRRTLPALAALLVIVFILVQGSSWLRERSALARLPSAATGSPNVVVVVIDTLRADHLSAYGYSQPTTPNIDRLAQQGVLFENAVSTTSWTFPSHVSLVTGRYPFEHGLGKIPPMPLWSNPDDIIRVPMIGEELQQRGYRTGAFSGNRLYFVNNLGFGRGFIHFEDYFSSLADMVRSTVLGTEFQHGMVSRGKLLRFLERLHPGGWLDRFRKKPYPRQPGEEVNRRVLRWIGEGPQAHPFFVFLNYFDVHWPYGGPRSPSGIAGKQDQPADEYDNGIKYVDDCVGQLMSELANRGLTQNTLVVITADHGELLGEHGLSSHGGSLYWDLIHVPLIFWYPGHVPAGVRVPNVVSNSVLAATLSSWLPGSHHFSFPGNSLTTLWNGTEPESASDYALAELSANALEIDLKDDWKHSEPWDTSGPMKSIATERWHLIMHKKFGNQLYEWPKDPQETHNLINTPEGRDAAGMLTEKLLNLLAGRRNKDGLEDALALNPDNSQRAKIMHKVTKLAPINDHYLLRANPGAVIALEVQVPPANPAPKMDSVLTVENASGQILQSCRKPNYRIPPPGTSDGATEDYDGVCVNDHVSFGAESVSRLDLRVPGSIGTPVDLYIRVTDWNGSLVSAGESYSVSVSEDPSDPVIANTRTAPQ